MHALLLLKYITYWKYKSIDVLSVQADIVDVFMDFSYQDIDSAVSNYNTIPADIIDNNVPQKSLAIT